MSVVGVSLNSTFTSPLLSKTYVALGAGIPNMQERSKDSSSMIRNICTVRADFIRPPIMDKVTNIIHPVRVIGAVPVRVLYYACAIPLATANVKACSVTYPSFQL